MKLSKEDREALTRVLAKHFVKFPMWLKLLLLGIAGSAVTIFMYVISHIGL